MTGLFVNIDWPEIGRASVDTLAMLSGSLLLSILFGLPLGVLLYLTGERGLLANRFGNAVLGAIVNVLRSVPFIILLIVMIPLTMALVGTSLGVAGAIPPLVVGAAPSTPVSSRARCARSTAPRSRRRRRWARRRGRSSPAR
jgi:D-methionine transport system permease protein